MKKYLKFQISLWIYLFLFFASSLSAQSTFYKKYNYSGDDFGHFVIETSDGGYAIIGSTNSTGAGNYDIWLLKTNANGDTLWTKTYGGPNNDEGYCLRQTNDNGFIITGYKSIPNHSIDGWVFKTDTVGNIEWEYTFGTDLNGESASSLVPTDENTFLVSGNLASKSYIFEIDIEGNILWEQSYFPNQNSSTTSICKINDSTFVVVGSFQMYSAGLWYPNLFTIDSEGNLGYQLTYALMGAGNFNFITNTKDGGMVFGGAENGENVVYKNSLSGIQEWEYRFYQEAWYQGATSAIQISDDDIIITDDTYNASLRKLNITTGDTLWTRTSSYNNDNPKYTNLTTTNDGGLIITGYTHDHDLILVKTLQNGGMTGIEDFGNIQKSITLNQNFPNPFIEQTELSFRLSKPESVELYITDINAKRVSTIINETLAPGEYKYTWDGINMNGIDCPSGIYLAFLKTKNGIIETQKLIKTLR